MKTKAIEVKQPSADENMNLKDLREVCFRVSEHITLYWGRIDRCMAYLTDDDRITLAKKCNKVVECTEKAAQLIKKLIDTYGELPF